MTSRQTPRVLWAAAVVLAGAGWCSAGLAAPATDEDPSPPPQSARPVTATANGRGSDTSGAGSKTADLLMQLQPRSAGLEFNERARAADDRPVRLRQAAPERQSPAAGGDTTLSAPPALYGAGATPMVQQRRPQASGDSNWSAGGGGSAQGSAPSPMPGWMLLPRDLIIWVREHRVLVGIGLALSLALVCAGSLGLGRKRR